MADRDERLRNEFETMQVLQAESTILDFTTENDPPDRYVVTFRGKGLNRSTAGDAEFETIELHCCEIRLPFSFPRRPPDIRWRTPIYHPNVSFSGLVKLRDVGLPWQESLGLDVVCARLWDVARLAYYDMDRSCNYAAKNWLEDLSDRMLPVDNRQLRDKTSPAASNVIRYERREGGKLELPVAPVRNQEVFYIDEDTPTPELPQPRPRRRQNDVSGDDDLFYIGDE